MSLAILTAYVETGSGIDEERTAAAEARVREWRERRELHLPTFSTSAIEELRGTIPYPPDGSSAGDDTTGT